MSNVISAKRIFTREIGPDFPPFVVAEIGINHEGDMAKAKRMIDDAAAVGAECVKFQAHVIEDEMSSEARKVIPGHTKESIWEIMERCAFSEEEDRELKCYTEAKGMIYLSTPFSRAAADRLERMGVGMYKIGSGECNNYPLVEHIARFGKPVILSTGMNDITSIAPSVEIFRRHHTPYALLHCTSLYPTPYEKVRLGAIRELQEAFPDAVVGLSDHSVGNYTSFAAIALGASILEKHFTSDKSWPGPDIAVSIDPRELKELIEGSRAISSALGGTKAILAEEKPTIDFAYATVVTIADIRAGEAFTKENIWVKRPGTGEIKAAEFERVIGKRAARDLRRDTHLAWKDIAAQAPVYAGAYAAEF
jgi:N-acetylneuraminate synthase